MSEIIFLLILRFFLQYQFSWLLIILQSLPILITIYLTLKLSQSFSIC